VVGQYDRRGNIYPTKAQAENKIDCAIATIMAFGASLSDAAAQQSQIIYEGRDLLVF